jgi:hypothetical protein
MRWLLNRPVAQPASESTEKSTILSQERRLRWLRVFFPQPPLGTAREESTVSGAHRKSAEISGVEIISFKYPALPALPASATDVPVIAHVHAAKSQDLRLHPNHTLLLRIRGAGTSRLVTAR